MCLPSLRDAFFRLGAGLIVWATLCADSTLGADAPAPDKRLLRYDPIVNALVPLAASEARAGCVYSHYSERLQRRSLGNSPAGRRILQCAGRGHNPIVADTGHSREPRGQGRPTGAGGQAVSPTCGSERDGLFLSRRRRSLATGPKRHASNGLRPGNAVSLGLERQAICAVSSARLPIAGKSSTVGTLGCRNRRRPVGVLSSAAALITPATKLINTSPTRTPCAAWSARVPLVCPRVDPAWLHAFGIRTVLVGARLAVLDQKVKGSG